MVFCPTTSIPSSLELKPSSASETLVHLPHLSEKLAQYFRIYTFTLPLSWSNTLSGNRSKPILNSSGKDDKQHVMVYNSSRLPLDRAGLILIALLRGGDYAPEGLPGCGVTTAYGLAKAGFGSALLDAFNSLPTREFSEVFLPRWRTELIDELRTDKNGCIGKKLKALAGKVPHDFPDLAVLRAYATPITSETEGLPLKSASQHWPTFKTKDGKGSGGGPDLALIARFCEMHFEWGYEQRLIERMRLWMWSAMTLQVIRRRVLLAALGDNDKTNYEDGDDAQANNELSLDMFKKIHSSRTHASTDGLLEYRIEFSPEAMVRVVRSGLRGLRQPPEKGIALGDDAEFDMGADESEEDEDDNDRLEQAGKSGKSKKSSANPGTVVRDWFPACMVKMAFPELVEVFEVTERQKAEKKARRGQGRTAVRKTQQEDGDTPTSSQNTNSNKSPRKKSTRTKSRSVTPAAAANSEVETILDLATSSPEPVARPLPRLQMAALYEEEEEDGDKDMPSLPPSPVKPLAKARARKAAAIKAASTVFREPEALFVEEDENNSPNAKRDEHNPPLPPPSSSAPKVSSRVLAMLDEINDIKMPGQSARMSSSHSGNDNTRVMKPTATMPSNAVKPKVNALSGPSSSSSHTSGMKGFFATTKPSRGGARITSSKVKPAANDASSARRPPSPIRAAASNDHEDDFMLPSEKWIMNGQEQEKEEEGNTPPLNPRDLAPSSKTSSKVLSALAGLDDKNGGVNYNGHRNESAAPPSQSERRPKRVANPFPLDFDDDDDAPTAVEEPFKNHSVDDMPHYADLNKEHQRNMRPLSPRKRAEARVNKQRQNSSSGNADDRARSASPPSPSLIQHRDYNDRNHGLADKSMRNITVIDISSDSDDDDQHTPPPPSQTRTTIINPTEATAAAVLSQPPLLLARSRRSKTAPLASAEVPTTSESSDLSSRRPGKDTTTTKATMKRRTFRTAASTSALVFSAERERQEQQAATLADVSMEVIDLT
jgi:hypothetical protein